MTKLTADAIRKAVRQYNARNAARYDYLHDTPDGITVFRRIVTEIPEELGAQSVSSGANPKKVIRLNGRKILPFIMEDAEPFCTVAELDALRAEYPDDIHSYGDALELYYHRLEDPHAVWVKNSDAFWMAGDIVINGDAVQLKYGGARLASYEALQG